MAESYSYGQNRPKTAPGKTKEQKKRGKPETYGNQGGSPPRPRRGYQPPLVHEPVLPKKPMINMLSGFRMAGDKGYINPPAEPEEKGPPNFAEYLSMFGGSGSSAPVDTSHFDVQEADLRRRGAEGTAAVGGIYQSLAKQLAGQQGQTDANYAQAQQQANQTAQQTAAAIASGGAAAEAQRTSLLRNLGMEEQAGSNVVAEATQDQADASADAARANQTTQGQLSAGALNMKNLNTTNQNAAVFRGAEEGTQIQSQLQSLLADLASQRAQYSAEASSQSSSQGFDMAKLMYENDNSRFNEDRRFGAQREDEMWDRSLDQRKFDASMRQDTPQDKSVSAQTLARMQGVPKQDQESIMDLLMSGGAVDVAGRSKITPQLLQSYGLDPKKYTPAYIGSIAMPFWKEYQA